MCGICGKVYFDASRRISAQELDRMRDAMRVRGPDAGESHVDRHAGIAHRRLSIIDVEGSAQPMANDDATVWITYNGEVYNFPELRKDLASRGHRFRTAGDTEVVLKLYEELGPECVTRLRGMFAFAIWDSRDDSLFLARDRLGVKPLYYVSTAEAFLFASELKSLEADPAFAATKEIDPQAVHAYLSFLCVPDPLCIYRGVRKLPAGHTLTLRNGRPSLHRYWDVRFDADPSLDERAAVAELSERLREAVRIRLVSDVPVGAFLSGGIDSSTVVALMAAQMDEPVMTFSIGFAERAHDEASDARRVANHLGTDHKELILDPAEAKTTIPDLLAYFDEPFADSSAIPVYWVSKLAREHVKVVLSGDGGDELFGGYPWRQARPRYQLMLSRLPSPLRKSLRHIGRRLPDTLPGSNFLRRADMPYERYILDAMAVFGDADRPGLYADGLAEAVESVDPYAFHLPHLRAGTTRESWAGAMMEYDLKTYLPNDILTKVDRMSMMNSLEAREPLLDHELVELAGRIPAGLKIRNGVTKYVLKQSIEQLLPRDVLTKAKHGFTVPLETWLRVHLKDDVLETLHGGNRHGFFDRTGVQKIVDEFYRGDDSRKHQVWTLYAFEHWYENVYRAAAVPEASACRK